MKRLACALAVVSLSMMGCGGSLCDDFADGAKSLNEKIKDCPSFSEVKLDEPTESQLQQCEDNLNKCSDADTKAINSFIDCVDKLDKCTPATEQAFSNSLVGCVAPLLNVSEGCGATSSSLPRQAEALFSSQR